MSRSKLPFTFQLLELPLISLHFASFPCAASLPFFGVQPCLCDEKGREVPGAQPLLPLLLLPALTCSCCCRCYRWWHWCSAAVTISRVLLLLLSLQLPAC